MDKRDVPLLTAGMATELVLATSDVTIKTEACLDAIACGDAATYNTLTHEAVPNGMREAAQSLVDWVWNNGGKGHFAPKELLDLRRALNVEKS